MDSLILQTVIGLVFLFATFAVLVSLLTELIARFIGLRGEYLLRGIRTLVDGGGDFGLGMSDMLRRVGDMWEASFRGHTAYLRIWPSPYSERIILHFLLLGLLTFLVALAGGIYFTWRKVNRQGLPLWNPASRQLSIQRRHDGSRTARDKYLDRAPRRALHRARFPTMDW